MPSFFLGIDLGSQGLKAVVIDGEGGLRGEEYVGYPIEYPQPAWAEQSPRNWEHAAAAAVSGAMRRADVSPDDIACVSFSSQLDGLVAVGADGRPLRPAIIWMDRRANSQCAWIARKISPEAVFSLTGLNLDSTHVLPKILWLRDNEPEMFSAARKFLLPGSYLLHYITGEWAVDYSNASSSLLLDVNTLCWSDKMLSIAELDPEKLAPVSAAAKIVGVVGAAFAKVSGLKTGTPVAAGAGDEHASAVGAGVVAPGLVCDILGTAEPVCTVSERLVFDETKLVETHANVDDKSWFIENPGFVSGGNYRWLRDNFGQLEMLESEKGARTAYELLNEQATAAPPGSGGVIFFPFMMGAMAPEWNPHARGMWAGLTLGHGRKHVIRAVLEGSAYALRDIVERMKSCGLPLNEIRVVGGGSRSALMEEIRADVTGIPVTHTAVVETAAYGAALIAAVGAGRFKDVREAAETCVRVVHVHEPDAKRKEIYDEMYRKYRRIYGCLKDEFAGLWPE